MSFYDQRKKKLPPEHRHNDQWCERHWAMFREPTAGGVVPNGIFAAIQLVQEFIDSPMVSELQDKSPEALNSAMQGDRPICCRLGEEVMQRILAKAVELGHKPEPAA